MSTTEQDPIQVLGEQIAGIRVAMLTTSDRAGHLCSRPMTTQQNRFDGTIWFLTDRRTHPAEDITLHPQVNVSYVDNDDCRYISVSGTATMVEDRVKVREFWQPAYAVWFPAGPDDPNLVLLRIQVERAGYWDSPSSWPGRLVAVAKALATDDKSALGTHGHIELSGNAG